MSNAHRARVISRKTAPHTLFNADIPTVAVAEPRRNAYVSAVVSMFFFCLRSNLRTDTAGGKPVEPVTLIQTSYSKLHLAARDQENTVVQCVIPCKARCKLVLDTSLISDCSCHCCLPWSYFVVICEYTGNLGIPKRFTSIRLSQYHLRVFYAEYMHCTSVRR